MHARKFRDQWWLHYSPVLNQIKVRAGYRITSDERSLPLGVFHCPKEKSAQILDIMPNGRVLNATPFLILEEFLNVDFRDRRHWDLWTEKQEYKGTEVISQCLDAPLRPATFCGVDKVERRHVPSSARKHGLLSSSVRCAASAFFASSCVSQTYRFQDLP